MDQVINDFVYILRQHSLRISPAESIDGMLALQVVGLGEREVVRHTLRTTLVKNAEDSETFDRLFDIYFGLHPQAKQKEKKLKLDFDDHSGSPQQVEMDEDWDEQEVEQNNPNEHSHEEGESPNLRSFFDEDKLREASQNIHSEPNRMRLSLFSQELILNRKQGAMEQILQRISYQLKVRRARNIFTPGRLAPHSNSEELPFDIFATDLRGLLEQLDEMDVDEELLQHLEAQAENIMKGLPELIKTMQERKEKLEAKPTKLSEVQKRSLVRLMNFSSGEERELEMAIRRLARQLHGASTRRRKQDRIGRISMPHTLRKNMAYEGIPFQPVLRRRREQRPRLVVLCDVSLSTRNLARFWLHLIYQMQSLFSKVRTFAFVAEMAEVTQLFEEEPFNRAVELLFGGDLLDVDVNSDFGRAAAQFRDNYMPAITRRTTLVILGDGRNNGKNPNIAAFEEITRHVKRVIWMTPEPKWGWSLGSCDMPLYEPLCHRIEVVRTIEQLAGVAEELVRVKSRPPLDK